jgi:hypothetical protein
VREPYGSPLAIASIAVAAIGLATRSRLEPSAHDASDAGAAAMNAEPGTPVTVTAGAKSESGVNVHHEKRAPSERSAAPFSMRTRQALE